MMSCFFSQSGSEKRRQRLPTGVAMHLLPIKRRRICAHPGRKAEGKRDYTQAHLWEHPVGLQQAKVLELKLVFRDDCAKLPHAMFCYFLGRELFVSILSCFTIPVYDQEKDEIKKALTGHMLYSYWTRSKKRHEKDNAEDILYFF